MKDGEKKDAALPDIRRDRKRALLHGLIAFAAMAALSYIVYVLNIPNPNVILMVGLVLFASLYGLGAGAVAAAVMVAYSMFSLSENHDWISFTPPSLGKLAVVAAGAVASALLVGGLNRRCARAVRQLSDVNRLLRADHHNSEEASLTDPLTGARNRFGLRQDYSRFERRYVHVMMLDLDDFRRSNDTYGHAVGDYMLKKVGRLLLDAFGADGCYRYGGDEFLVICKDMDEAVFTDRLDALKQSMNAIYLNDKHLQARFSAGYVYGDCERSDDLRLMMHQADGNLSEAKRLGRNRWVGGAFSRDKAASVKRNARADEPRVTRLSDWF